jgi:hypothetical protein
MPSKAQQAWNDLNARQQSYLRVLYTEDQGLEDEHDHLGALGHWSRTPARVWRRIQLTGRYAPTPAQLRALGIWSGSGATLGALADRGLIELGTDMQTGRTYALLTRAGRAAVRAGYLSS